MRTGKRWDGHWAGITDRPKNVGLIGMYRGGKCQSRCSREAYL